jgi:hypothetical protein
MKHKILLLLLVMVVAKINYAQKTSVGFCAGGTLASMHSSYNGESDNSNWKPGVMVGIYTKTPLSKNFLFMPALNAVQKGAIPKGLETGEKETLTINYLELPLNVVYSNNGFMAGIGPSFGLGINGKHKYSSDGQPEEKTDLKFGDSEGDDVKQFEIGGNLLAGYQFKGGFLITANYNMGLSTIIPNAYSDFGKATNNYFGLTVGYTIPTK